jgi:acetyl-CoA carboxylase carboxyl transferase subunit alpha
MPGSEHRLPFERPIYELEERLEKLRSKTEPTPEVRDEIRRLRRQRVDLIKQIYRNLTPWQTVEVARHPERPMTADYLTMIFEEFLELHGDRFFGDDRAIRTGLAKLDAVKVLVVGHQKGKNFKERSQCNYGFAHPEGYRKALSKMRLAEKFHLPIICLIDTGGAYPGIGAEERGQAYVIAKAMYEMSRLRTPIVCVVIGEGGSGGALGLGVGDRVAMLEHAYYSVISPEGCAGILWKSAAFKERAAEALKFTAPDLLRFGVIDEIISEPLGGAHRDPTLMANRMKFYLRNTLRELTAMSRDQLVETRYQKFRRMGIFLDDALPEPLPAGSEDGLPPPHRQLETPASELY